MKISEQFQQPSDFWKGMVIPDFEDYQANLGSLRKALHLAISLFHMSDWVFRQNQISISNTFTFTDNSGNISNVHSAGTFANSLEQIESNFALIRGIAHAAKHFQLRDIRPHVDAPSNSANTASQSLGFSEGAYGTGPQVMLEGASGHLHFSKIAESIKIMWENLNLIHQWW